MVCTAPQKSPGYSFSLQPSQVHVPRPPTRCHSQCCAPVLDCVSTPFALRPQHGTPVSPPRSRGAPFSLGGVVFEPVLKHQSCYDLVCSYSGWLLLGASLAFVSGCSFGSVYILASVFPPSVLLCHSSLPPATSYGFFDPTLSA